MSQYIVIKPASMAYRGLERVARMHLRRSRRRALHAHARQRWARWVYVRHETCEHTQARLAPVGALYVRNVLRQSSFAFYNSNVLKRRRAYEGKP